MTLEVLDDEPLKKVTAEIIKLSASSVKTYDQCPRKYYYNYVDKQPTKEWDHFDLGNLCHKSLEIFHKRFLSENYSGKLSDLMTQSFFEARASYPNMKAELLQEAKVLLVDYLSKVAKSGMPNVIGVEQEFTLDLAPNIIVRGFLDRLDFLDAKDRYHIVDYKTTKNEKYLDPLQLQIYGLWLKSKYPEITNFDASYVLLRQQSSYKSYSFNLEDLKKTKKDLISYANRIKAEDTWVPIPTALCNWCDFKSICPSQKEGW